MAAAFAMVACQTGINEVGVVADGVSAVEFEVGAPQMRSYSDGSTATVLQYAVYDANGDILSELNGSQEIHGRTTVRLELAKNKTYSVIFWAAAPSSPYTVDFENKKVDVTYGGLCNDESRDAFYAYLPFEVTGAATLSVELRRPFAQVNIGASDVAEAAKSKFVPSESQLVVKNVYSTLNLVNGTASNDVAEVTFAAATVPTGETFPVTGYDYLAMSYVLVGKDQAAYDVVYTIKAEDNTVITNTIGAVPMQANYRTNIYGKLLTSQTDINVEINPDYEQPDYNENVPGVKIGETRYNTLAEAYAAAVDGDVLVLMGDQQISESFVNTKNITLNLNGAVLSQVKECTASYEMIYNKGTLTIIDEPATRTASTGKISFKDTSAGDPTFGWGSYTVRNEGTLVVNGGTIEHLGEQEAHMICAIFQYSGTSTINGGVISTPNYRSARLWNGNMTINGGVFEGQLWLQGVNGTSNLTINGGQFSPRGGDSSSVFVTNSPGTITFAVNGGTFATKIGASIPTAEGVAGAIKGGVFTTAAKEGTNAALLATNYNYVENEDGTWTVESPGYYVDASGNYHITTAKGWLAVANEPANKFSYKTIYLENDINFAGISNIKPIVFSVWEAYTTFDGQNHTVSNIFMATNYDKDNQALFDGLITVKNLNVVDTHVYGMSRVGIIGANIYGTIENCHVKDCRAYGYVWQIGGIVGLHSWGEIKNCSVENTSVECYYYGAVGAIAGAMNEVSRKITGCSIKNCELKKEGTEYEDYNTLFGAVVGYIYGPGNYEFSCEIEGFRINGAASTQVYGLDVPAGTTITVNGIKEVY